METNSEISRRRLGLLSRRKDVGGIAGIAEKTGLSYDYLDQIIKGVKLPEKKDGTRSQRALGEPAARAIEAAFDLGRGWLDWPLDAVDYKKYSLLSELDKGFAQSKMMQVIDDRLAQTPTVEAPADDLPAPQPTQGLRLAASDMLPLTPTKTNRLDEKIIKKTSKKLNRKA